jgi:hypothetical protein
MESSSKSLLLTIEQTHRPTHWVILKDRICFNSKRLDLHCLTDDNKLHGSLETSETTHLMTQGFIIEKKTLQQHRCENLKSWRGHLVTAVSIQKQSFKSFHLLPRVNLGRYVVQWNSGFGLNAERD